MSASDYISLKKSRMLQNYAPILSTNNDAVANYDHYVRKLALNVVSCATSKDIYGFDEPASLNGINLNDCTYPENSFDGIINVVLLNPEKPMIPLKSTPSVPAKLQVPCYKGEQPCTTFFQAKRANYISKKHRRQWNLKKPSMLKITDSTTFRM
jgi:hypothetical protein